MSYNWGLTKVSHHIQAQAVDRRVAWFIGVALVVSSVQLAIPVAGLSLVTTNRLALAVLVIGSFYRILVRPGQPLRFARRHAPLLIGLSACIIWGLCSMLQSPYPTEVSAAYVVSWILVAVFALLFAVSVSGLTISSKTFLLNILIVGAAIVTVSTLVFLIAGIGLSGFRDPLAVRKFFILLGPGLNRHMVGLFSLNCVCFAVLLGIVKRGIPLLVTATMSVAVFIVLVMLSGSRQTLVGILLYVPLVWLISRGHGILVSDGGMKFLRAAGRAILGVGVLYIALRVLRDQLGYDVIDWFQTRFLERTLDQYEAPDDRMQVFRAGVELIARYPLWGVGPGVFIFLNDLLPHNGPVRLASELGLPALGFIVSAVIWTLVGALRRRRIAFASGFGDLFSISLAFLAVYFFASNMFNDLLNDYPLWGYAVLLTASCTTIKRDPRSEDVVKRHFCQPH